MIALAAAPTETYAKSPSWKTEGPFAAHSPSPSLHPSLPRDISSDPPDQLSSGKFCVTALTGCPLSTSFLSFRGWTSLNEQVDGGRGGEELRGVTRDFPTITRYRSSFEGRTTTARGRRREGRGRGGWAVSVGSSLPLGRIPPFRHAFPP